MAERGQPSPKLPTMHKPVKTKTTDPPQPVHQPQLKPEALVPPDQIPDPAPPNPQDPPTPAPPAHIPDPVQPQNPPVHVPDVIQPQNPPSTCTLPNISTCSSSSDTKSNATTIKLVIF